MTPTLHDGYCDTTGFNNAGACENDDKGSFDEIKFSHLTWAEAAQKCSDLCGLCRALRLHFALFEVERLLVV